MAEVSRPLTLGQVWSLNAMYSDPQRGLTFRYPATWKPATAFGYIPPALTFGLDQSEAAPRVAGFGYSTGGFPKPTDGPYAATNLEGFGLVFFIQPATSKAVCDRTAGSLAKFADSESVERSATKIAGRIFSVYQVAGEAMNQTYYGALYANFTNGACYLVETGVATILNPEVNGVKVQLLSPAQLNAIQRHLRLMMDTVRIISNR